MLMYADRLSHFNRHLLLDFDCGDAVYQREVGQQIRELTPERCTSSGMIAWVFSTDTHPSAGFGSYMTTTIWPPYDPNSMERVIVGYIPLIALRPAFQGQPPGAQPSDRYSGFVMKHIILHAAHEYLEHIGDRGRQPLLIGEVHVNNEAALKFNRNFGFQAFGVPATYDDGIYLKMFFNLEDEVHRILIERQHA